MSGVQLTVQKAAEATGGFIERPGAGRFCGVSIDSRQVQAGHAFVAIKGERFDGHDFCSQAVRAGATLLVVERELALDSPATAAVLRVTDTRTALGKLARAWRGEVNPHVVAITGSVGKTTTKELTRSLVSRLGSTHSNPGNFNNDIGLPLTMLAMPSDTRYLVVEMGMNAPGEIATLTELAAPDVGVITCVAPVHLEGLGSLEAIAEAKGELLTGLGPRGWAVVPGQEPLLAGPLQGIPKERRVTFGAAESDAVQIVGVQSLGPDGSRISLSMRDERVTFDLALVGAYNARNAAAAAAAAMILGLDPQRIAESMQLEGSPLKHRSAIRSIGGYRVLDDCYNANPLAMRAALQTVSQLAGSGSRALAVLGTMLELGEQTERLHKEVGQFAASLGLKVLITVGPGAEAIAVGAREAGMPDDRIARVSDARQAAGTLASRAAAGDWILVKASRGAHLEQVIDEIATTCGKEKD
jgi:UDP-N-acetylmuramoyl-tripeptide--D-alanyl-D-alanine ligase